nr:major capsid protein [Myoviridae environmental samples]
MGGSADDIWGVQPMTGPTGLIFAMRSRFSTQGGSEALFNEANTTFSGSAAGNTASRKVVGNTSTGRFQQSNDPTDRASAATTSSYTVSTGMARSAAEALGDGSANAFQEMAFSIEKVAVTAVSRALKAEYTMELAQDLKAIHGLDAETELSNILAAEIMLEINREIMLEINRVIFGGFSR